MKIWKIPLLGIAIFANISSAAPSIPKIVDKVSAIVNNSVILKSDVDDFMQSVKRKAINLNQQIPNDFELRNQILERLIMDQILLQISQKMDIKISDEQLDQAIANIAKQKNITLSHMWNRLASEGIDYDTYRHQIYKEMLISTVYSDEVRHRIQILPQEVEALIKQSNNQNDIDTKIKLDYIFIPLPENPTSNQIAETESQVHSITELVRQDSNFGKLMTIYSTDLKTLKIGNIDWIHMKELPSAFIFALNKAKKRDIIGPIRSNIGFYILKVSDLLHEKRKNMLITEVHARHILLKPSLTTTNEQIRRKLNQIAFKIKSGKISFANAAKEFSQDLDSANQGGDLGWVIADAYDPPFRDAIMKLNKGQISKSIRSSFGWHLIELLDIRNVDKTEIMQKNEAYQKLFSRKFTEEAVDWMQEQRANAYVKVLGIE